MPIIHVENVSKIYRGLAGKRILLGRGGLGDLFRPRPTGSITALHDISFSVEPGESLGIIGANGSGKSTLLKIIGGVTLPTTGTVSVYGRVASLLELGAGFHPMLTGRENIYLYAGLLGLRHAQTDRVFDDIVRFSEMGEYLDNPVDTYSSGMFVRLAFSVAVHTDPDVFLVDEVLAVGDEAFQRKCRERIGLLREQNKTIVFVSHDLGIVRAICDRVILLSKGAMVVRETPQETIDYYLRQIGEEEGIHKLVEAPREAILSHGRVALFHERREVTAPHGAQVVIRYERIAHSSEQAHWTLVERAPNRCVARGRMYRLPLTHVWTLEWRAGSLIWTVGVECERELPYDEYALCLQLPAEYVRWTLGEDRGAFPPIEAGDLHWRDVSPSDTTAREAEARSGGDAAAPPVRASFESPLAHLRVRWRNTDCTVGTRALEAWTAMTQEATRLTPGYHHVVTLRLDLGDGAEPV